MNCPYCGSKHLEEASNFNEFICELCKCEFKKDGDSHQIFEDGNYKKFCENVMYKLCETASPKVSHIIVSVLSQLKNNGVEEIDTIIEHFQLVSSNVTSEIVLGLQTESDLEVVNEGINYFTTIGNTLLKRDDLELDLSRFTRFFESLAFYENTYVSSVKSPLVRGFKKGAVDENMIPRVGGGVVGGVSDNLPGVPDPDAAHPECQRCGGEGWIIGQNGGESECTCNIDGPLPPLDGMGETSIIPTIDPTLDMGGDPLATGTTMPPPADANLGIPDANTMGDPITTGTMAPAPVGGEADLAAAHAADVGEMGSQPLPPDMGGDSSNNIDDELMQKIAEIMANQYNEGAIDSEADFMESLLNCEAANGMCENIGSLSEEQVYKIAEMVSAKIGEMSKVYDLNRSNPNPDIKIDQTDVVDDAPVSPEQLQEALDILTSSLKLTTEELKDL